MSFEPQQFGRFSIAPSQQFFQSSSSCAFVNLKPIVPGHVLVIPKRLVVRLKDLTDDECDDLFRTVRIVESKIENHYGANACNVAIQDGKDAGQSVPHVHVHILPRHAGDAVVGDEIYDELEKWAPRDSASKPKLAVAGDEHRNPRTEEEMTIEAGEFRTFF